MKARIKLLTDTARVPTYATDGSAAFDIYADMSINIDSDDLEIISTGIAVEVPDGHVLLIHSRSGHGFRYGLRLSNCTGVIDSDYRGEIKVAMTLDMPDGYVCIERGDRIAQGMIVPVERVEFELTDELSETVRGNNGLGSTGK